MPHKNALKKLETYGKDVLQLDSLCNAYFKNSSKYGLRDENLDLKAFLEYSASLDMQTILPPLHMDKYVYIRELAAGCVQMLWQGWKVIPYKTNRKSYAKSIKEYAHNLRWTWEILDTLLIDPCYGPAKISLDAVCEMEYDSVGVEVCEHFRPYILQAFQSMLPDIRFGAIQALHVLYPYDDDAHNILEADALQAYIDATRDPIEKNRDWACFKLHNFIANLTPEVETAFIERFKNEIPGSDVYAEAVFGLARMGRNDLVEDLICEKLAREDFGTGWVDAAAEYCHTPKCRTDLTGALAMLNEKFPEDSCIDRISEALNTWDDPD